MLLANNTAVENVVPAAEMQVMLVSRDRETITLFSDVLREIGVGVQHCTEESSAIARFAMARFEAVVLDCDIISDIASVIRRVRESPSSKNALVFAVATASPVGQCALQRGINFLAERPLKPRQVSSILRIAYGLMLQDRRRYFRHAVSVPVCLTTSSGQELHCTTINISRDGMAVCVPSSVDLADVLEITLKLPEDDSLISATGTVIWHDNHGKAGLRFKCSTPDNQARLEVWLDAKFYGHFRRSSL